MYIYTYTDNRYGGVFLGALQTLVHFLNQLQLRLQQEDSNEINTEMIGILDKLMKIDSDRKIRYKDQSKFLSILFRCFHLINFFFFLII